MSCPFDRDLLQEYAIGEVSPAERSEVETHLATCALCRGEVALDRRMARDLASLPEPEFPLQLEEVLIRASLQAWRSQGPRRVVLPSTSRAVWPYLLGGLAGAGVLVLAVLLLWPGRLFSWTPMDRVIGGGTAQGLGLLDGVLRLVSDLRAGWDTVRGFMTYLSPISKAVRVAFNGIGGSIWIALALGVFGSTFLLWRIARTGQKRSVEHAKSGN